MIALLGSRSAAVTQCLSRCAQSGSHRLVVARDSEGLSAALQCDDPGMLMLDATSWGDDWPGQVRRMRSLPTYRYLSVIGTGGPAESLVAYQSGADEYVRFPVEPSEFGARLTALERLTRHLRATSLSAGEGPALVAALSAWDSLEACITRALGDMLCADVQQVQDPLPSGNTYTARLRLSLVEPRASMVLYLVATETALHSMAQLLLGSVAGYHSPEVLVDVSKETLNTLVGAFKRNALPNHDFICGVPDLAGQSALQQSVRGAAFMKSWNVGWGRNVVGLYACISEDDVVSLPLHSLVEGMVLADDIRNPTGLLIAPRGTCLTEHAIKRLYSVFGGAAMLRVSNAA